MFEPLRQLPALARTPSVRSGRAGLIKVLAAPRRARGQILVMFPATLAVLLLLATLTLDGAMMQQSQRDLEIIATHAARAGAVQIDRPYFIAQCDAYIVTHTYYLDPTNTFVVPAGTSGAIAHTPTAGDCNIFLILDPVAASTAASASASSWLAQVNAQQINLPGFAPNGIPDYGVSFGPGNKTITVTVRWCYQPMLLKDFFNSATCPRAVLVVASYTAEALAGQ